MESGGGCTAITANVNIQGAAQFPGVISGRIAEIGED